VIRLGYAAKEASSGGDRSQAQQPGALPPRERTGSPPASFAQEQFWFVDQVAPGNAAYNFSWPVRLRGPLDVPALERALAEVVRRHEALRTGFALEDGRPVQVIAAPGPFALELTDLSRAGDLEGDALRLVAEESLRAFDLGGERLFRARLLRLGEADHILQVLVHHVVFDEWSKVVLFHGPARGLRIGAAAAARRGGTRG
jgi:hypothetical protein